MSPAVWMPPSPLPAETRSPRLIIRFPGPADAAAMFEAIESSRDSLVPWLPWAQTDNRSVAECLATIERFRASREQIDPPAESYLVSLVDPTDGSIIGGSSYHRIRPALAEAEVGYWVRASHRGRGLCTEAVAAMLSWGFAPQPRGWGFRRIVVFCADLNIASRRIPEKLGLRLELRANADRWIAGMGYCGSLGWGVLAEEWDIEGRRLRAQ